MLLLPLFHSTTIMEQTYSNMRKITFLAILVGVSIAFISLVSDFLMACFWATVLAIVFSGVNEWFYLKVKKKRNLSAFVTTILILFVVLVPVAVITLALVGESQRLYESIQTGNLEITSVVDDLQTRVPAVERLLNRVGMTIDDLRDKLNSFATSVTKGAANQALKHTQNAISFTIQFTLMLYLLFFFLRDGKKIIQAIKDAFPLGDATESILFDRFAQVSRATVKGTLIVALIQGTIGGVLFASLGIPGAMFWGVLMTILSLLPVGGSGFVWIPAAIILIIQGNYGKATIMVVVGSLIIGLIDNLLRPLLVGRETQMPDYLVLLATLGGIAWFGLSGFIIGPVIAALFVTCWQLINIKILDGPSEAATVLAEDSEHLGK